MFESIIQEASALRGLELIAVVLAVVYVVLAARPSIWCWPAGLISSLIFVYVLGKVTLYQDAILNLFYAGMAVWGWIRWRQKDNQEIKVSTRSLRYHSLVLIGGGLLTLASGTGFQYLGNDLAYFDAFTTVFSIITTFMLINKVVENWVYWMVIDLVAAYVYYLKDLPFTMVLFVAYFFLSAWAFYRWRKQMQIHLP